MGRSVGKPGVEINSRFHHNASGSVIQVRRRGSQLEHRIERRGISATYPVAYSVGAGLVGHSYIVRIGDYLFQSPISFYTRTNTWDVTPGDESKKHLDFSRQITSGCLFCHTGSVHLVAGTTNRFEEPAFTPISCERCHGDARRHLLQPMAGSIINPARLAPHERDSICEQCHLEGVTRILNPGRDWFDYKPGDLLEKTFVTYLEDAASAGRRAVSHSEQLTESRCARESGGRLWCGTCHHPHSSSVNRTAEVRQTCLSCHQQLFAAAKHAPADDCVACHMPRLRPADITHAAVRDHRIVRSPGRNKPPAPLPAALRAWREPDPQVANRDLGIAYFEWAALQPDARKITRAYELLSSLPAAARDPVVLSDLGSILLQQGQHRLAVQLFAQASNDDPDNPRYLYGLGIAHEQAGYASAAIEDLRRCIYLDRSQLDAYLALARIYESMGRQSQKDQVLREYLRFMPQNLSLRSID